MAKINKTMMQYFEWYLEPNCGLWNKIVKEAKYLESIGITGVWLPPAYKGSTGTKDTGYAVYDLYDLGEFNQKGSIATKYGTKEEYINAIKVLKGNNMEVYADVVLNHRLGADETEEVLALETSDQDRNVPITKPKIIQAWTKFNFDARGNQYSDFKWNWTHFHGVDFDEIMKKYSIYKFYGKHWDEDVDKENGNYDYLMGADVDFNNVDVTEELKKWGKWYIDETHADGFRLDAVKHIRASFLKEWVEEIKNVAGENFKTFGEYWSNHLESLKSFIEQTKSTIALFDVPLHYNFYHASICGDWYDMRTILANSLAKSKPDLAITFVDNHDTQLGQSLFSWVQDWFKPLAYAIILLRREGEPCVFYGDYYGIPHDQIMGKKDILEILLKARRYFAYGRQNDYFNHNNVIGWTREGEYENPDSGMAVILSNKDAATKEMNIGSNLANAILYDCTGNIKDTVLVDENGNVKVSCLGRSVSVWIKKENIYMEQE